MPLTFSNYRTVPAPDGKVVVFAYCAEVGREAYAKLHKTPDVLERAAERFARFELPTWHEKSPCVNVDPKAE